MKLHIVTQYMENYGAHDWDGEGECPQRWKFKGGEDYFYQLGAVEPSAEHVEELVFALRGQIEWSNVASQQYITGYGLVEDSFMTEFERSQLEYEGTIQFPAKMLTLDDVAEEQHYYFGA